MCSEAAQINRVCFTKGTNESEKNSLLQILDSNGDGFLDFKEYKQIYVQMDLNKDVFLSIWEIGAWFTLNEYAICGPFKTEVLSRLDNDEMDSIRPFSEFIDLDNDVNIAKMDTNKDGILSKFELEVISGPLIKQMCEEGPNLDREGWLRRSNPLRGVKKDLFAVLDGNDDGKVTPLEYMLV